jgi:hypothetical protein
MGITHGRTGYWTYSKCRVDKNAVIIARKSPLRRDCAIRETLIRLSSKGLQPRSPNGDLNTLGGAHRALAGEDSQVSLEAEAEFFNLNREKWLQEGREGEWVVIHKHDVLGFYSSLRSAYAAGVKVHGNATDFFVKQITTPDEEIETIQRVHWGATCGSKSAI